MGLGWLSYSLFFGGHDELETFFYKIALFGPIGADIRQIRAYLLQTLEMQLDAHWHGFRVFGGIPDRGIDDNTRTAVDRVGRGLGEGGGREECAGRKALSVATHAALS